MNIGPGSAALVFLLQLIAGILIQIAQAQSPAAFAVAVAGRFGAVRVVQIGKRHVYARRFVIAHYFEVAAQSVVLHPARRGVRFCRGGIRPGVVFGRRPVRAFAR